MDLDKYLERDIIEFLDVKLQERESNTIAEAEEGHFSLSLDYNQLLENALETRNGIRAKKLFEDVKSKLADAKNDDARDAYTKVLENMFTKLHTYGTQQHLESGFIDDIMKLSKKNKEEDIEINSPFNYKGAPKIKKPKSMDESYDTQNQNVSGQVSASGSVNSNATPGQTNQNVQGVASNQNSNSVNSTSNSVGPIQATGPIQAKIEDQKLRVKLRKDIEYYQAKISEFIDDKDVQAALKEYKNLKTKFDEYPDIPVEEKEELFHDVISAYYQIGKLNKVLKEEQLQKETVEIDEKTTFLKEIMTKVQVISKRIDLMIASEKITEAMNQYNDLKELFETFPNEYLAEKKALYVHTLKLFKKIQLIAKKKTSEKAQILKTKQDELNIEGVKEKEVSVNFKLEIKKSFRETINLMKKRDLENAGSKLIESKHLIEELPKGKEKEMFENLADEVMHRLNFLRSTTELEPNVRNKSRNR
jgi:hypothetical protein